jgi:gliding motility-associated-like protein
MLKFLPITILVFFWGIGLSSAQVGFSAPDLETCEATVSVPVTVTGFNNITAFSFSMEWDETVLQFDSVGAFNLQFLDAGDFGTTQSSNGILTAAWISDNGTGQTASNGTAIFRLFFTVIGANGSSSPINFTDSPTTIVVGQGFPPASIPVTTSDGSVTIGDSTPPSITCPANVAINTPGTSAVVNGIAPTASDNCGTPTVTFATTGATVLSGGSNASGQTFNAGVTTVTYTATDGQGNTSNCSFTVTVTQVVNAVVFSASSDVANCNDTDISIAVTVENFSNITAFSFSLLWDETVIGYASLTNPGNLQHLDNGDFGLTQTSNGVMTVAWVDDDGSGETLMDGDTLFIINFNVLGVPGNSSVIEFSDMPTDVIAGQGFPPVSIPVITQDGNAAIVDAPPVISGCPANITLSNTAGLCSAIATWTAPTANDDCDGPVTPVQTAGPASGSAFPKGVTTVTYKATDSKGQMTTCSFTVTVNDTENPVATCPASFSVNNDAGVCSATVTYTATVTDNCPGATISPNILSGSTFPIGPSTVTYTATDASGNTAACSFVVTVVDNEDPVINNCPSNITQNNTPGQCSANVTWTAPTATDNCTNPLTPTGNMPPGNFPVGTATVTYTATDAAGNTATCSFTVTVNDTQLPVLTGCPIAISVNNAPGECGANVTWTAPTASDNCGVASITPDHANGSFFDVGTTSVIYKATDVNGNMATCTFTVTVVDMEDPEITCPANFTQDNDPGVCEATITLPAPVDLSDNCLGVTYTSTPASGSTFLLGTTTVTYEATDAAGRTASCTFEVTVADAEAPDITCPANISQDNDMDECSAVVMLPSATTDDLCSLPVTVTNDAPAGNEFPVGTTTVTYTATDDAGNTATCSITVTVNDTQEPIITNCPGNIMEATDPGSCDAIVNWTAPTASDNCTATLTASHDPGDTFPKGTTTVTYTAEDGDGNTATCSFDVTVEDGEAPELECIADVTVQIPSGTTSGVVNDIPLFSLFDNCGVDTSYWHFTGATTNDGDGANASGETFNLGVTTVTYFAEDAAGNVGNCSFTVTVEEENLLEITCPGNQSSINDAGDCSAAFSGLAATVVPASGATNLSYTFSGATTGSGNGQVPDGTSFNTGTTTVTYTTFNSAGSVNCSFTVTVTDDEAPAIAGCPAANITVPNDPGVCGAVVSWTEPTASDNCGVIAFTVSQDPGTLFDVQMTPVEYVAVDAAGNVSKCQFKVIVQDTEKPVFTVCPGNFTVNADPGDCSALIAWAAPAASDNCSAILTTTHQPGSTFDVGTSQVQYKATDPSGNMATCSFNITVIDNQLPFIFNIPSNLVVFTEPDECGAIVSWPSPGAQDNCGIESFGCNFSPGTFFDVTTPGNPAEVECIALDIHGNVKIQSFTITVIDNTPPAIVCPGNVTVSVDGGTLVDPAGFLTGVQPMDCQKTVLSYSLVTATDACGIASIVKTQGPASGSAFGLGTNTMSFKAMDIHGNESTCSFTVEVIPTEAAVADAFPLKPCEGEEVFFFVNDYPNATYTWKDPNGNVVGSGDSFTLPAIDASQEGLFTVDIFLPYCQLQGSVPIDVAPVPDLDLTANDLLCTTGNMPLNLAATDLANSGVVEWIWEFPNGSFAFGQNQTVNNATPANSGTYSLTAVNADGCVGFGEIFVQIFSEPMTPTVFGTSSAVCKGAQVILNGQSFSGSNVSYHWSATPAAGSGLNPINNSLVSVTPTEAGQYTYSYYVSVDGCTSNTATWVVDVEAAPVLALSIDGQTACVDGTSPVTLMESGGQATNWQWEGPSGPIPGNSSSVVLQNVNTASSGLYKVVAATDLGCQSTASIPLSITMKPSPAAQLVASTDAICSGGTVTLSGTPYSGATYVWTGPNLPPFPQNLSSVNVTLSQAGNFDYTFAAVVNGCSTDVVSASILVESMPALSITATGETKCVNGATSVVLSSNSPNAASWQWTDAAGNVLTNTENLTLTAVTSANSGTYSVTASSSIGCKSTGSYTLNITDGLPPITASLDGKACDDAPLMFDATILPGATYAWKNPAGNIFSTLQSPVIQTASPALNGNYIVTASMNGCISSDTVNVSVLTAPDAVNEQVVGIVNVAQSFNVIVNDILVTGEPYTISVLQQPQNGTVSVGSQGVLTFHPDHGFREKDKMFYEICYQACPDLCDIASVDIQVVFPDSECVITTVITPNNDGINDDFVVSCLELSPDPQNTLTIFNQWGDKVYDAAPYKNDWKGTYEGRDLPDGTYFYIFQLNPDKPAKKGFVMIYR